MRVAVYHRPEKETSPAETIKQMHELKEFCESRGFEITHRYEEKIEGDRRQRPVFIQMMKDASRKKFDAVVVWSFKNFRRFTGIKDIKYIIHLKELGVRFISYQEPFFDTSSQYSDILFRIFEWLAEDNAKTISERTKFGIERAKRQGVVIGRPKLKVDVKKAIELRKQGKTLREIAEILKVSKETTRRIIISNQMCKDGEDKSDGDE